MVSFNLENAVTKCAEMAKLMQHPLRLRSICTEPPSPTLRNRSIIYGGLGVHFPDITRMRPGNIHKSL